MCEGDTVVETDASLTAGFPLILVSVNFASFAETWDSGILEAKTVISPLLGMGCIEYPLHHDNAQLFEFKK